MYKIWASLAVLALFVMNYISTKAGLIILLGAVGKALYDMGVFTSTKFYQANLKGGKFYYKPYKGSYNNIGKEFSTITMLRYTLNVNTGIYPIVGIYYDDPQTTLNVNSRAVIGIMKQTKVNLDSIVDTEEQKVEEKLLAEGFKVAVIPDTVAISSSFPWVNRLSIMLANYKFYSALAANLKQPNFRKSFRLEDDRKHLVVEVLGDKKIDFYVPVKNQEKFELHTV